MGKGRGHEAPGRADEPARPASRPVDAANAASGAQASAETFVASHEVLFAQPTEVRCDACGAPVTRGDDPDEAFGVPGEGVYLWARGDELRFERAPLCVSCASAIGMTALARWEIEEEEG